MMRGVVFSVVMVLAVGGFQTAGAQDLVIFENGDRLTGSIERLERGNLVLSVPFVDGDVHADWAQVVRVESQRFFQFETVTGRRFLGRIRPETDPEAGLLVVEVDGVIQSYRRDEIVNVVRTVGELHGLLEISVSAGLSLSQSNDQKQFNADARVGYEGARYGVSADVTSLFSTQREGADTHRQSVGARFTRFIGDRWGLSILNEYLQSEEQRLNLRTVLGAGPSRTFVRDGRIELSALAGLVWNNERFDPQAERERSNDLEAVGGLFFSFYQFKQWELNATALMYPSITTKGRTRSSLRANLRLRLIQGKPLWFNINQTIDLDSDPPANASGTDHVTTTSISYDFP
jgi:hypothetical protein